jgi:hypothetical protein
MTRKVISTLLVLAGAVLILPVLAGLAFILFSDVSAAIVAPWGVLAPALAILAGLGLIWSGLRLGRHS